MIELATIIFIIVYIIIYIVFYFQFLEKAFLRLFSSMIGHRVRRRWQLLETAPIVTSSTGYVDPENNPQQTPREIKNLLLILNFALIIIATIFGTFGALIIILGMGSLYNIPKI